MASQMDSTSSYGLSAQLSAIAYRPDSEKWPAPMLILQKTLRAPASRRTWAYLRGSQYPTRGSCRPATNGREGHSPPMSNDNDSAKR
jgi:hypothetical protein